MAVVGGIFVIIRRMLLSKLHQSTSFFKQVYYRVNINQCVLCLNPSESNICPTCQQRLPTLKHHCPMCAEPSHHDHLCGACLSKPPAFKQVICPFILSPPISTLVKRWKDSRKHVGSDILIQALLNKLQHYSFDAIVYVPYHWSRLLKRGKHPVRQIAQCISKELNAPLLDVFTRLNQQHTQKGLSRKERQANLRYAFAINKKQQSLDGLNVLLVDDVLTTGATAHRLSMLLNAQGARSVSVACLARTPLKPTQHDTRPTKSQ